MTVAIAIDHDVRIIRSLSRSHPFSLNTGDEGGDYPCRSYDHAVERAESIWPGIEFKETP